MAKYTFSIKPEKRTISNKKEKNRYIIVKREDGEVYNPDNVEHVGLLSDLSEEEQKMFTSQYETPVRAAGEEEKLQQIEEMDAICEGLVDPDEDDEYEEPYTDKEFLKILNSWQKHENNKK